jgi:hypothetical protein
MFIRFKPKKNPILTVVVDVTLSEAERRSARVQVRPVVVRVRHTQSSVLRSVRVRVADQRRLPVVRKLRPRYGHAVRAVRDVEKSVVVVLVVVPVRREVEVVDPHLGCLLDADGIAGVGEDLGDLEVANDDVLDLEHPDADTDEA